MYNPGATYRLQLNKDFSFKDLNLILPYLQKLGVLTLYASPIFEAVPGSTHGYDVTNPQNINPEIGTLKELKIIGKHLKNQGMGWLQDIVPNHMAYHSKNAMLMDLLEKGQLSVFKNFFDQGLTGGFSPAKIMVPFLGSSLEEVLEKGELSVVYQQQQLQFGYFDAVWPLNIRSYLPILSAGKGKLKEAFVQLMEQVNQVHQLEDQKMYALAVMEIKSQLDSLIQQKKYRVYINSCLTAINADKVLLLQLSEEQEYRLCAWRETDSQINYRRFFTVNGLICMNMQHTAPFRVSHRLTRSLIKSGLLQGLRIDHIDGLYDPGRYLNQLRNLAGKETYIVVEKILEQNEELPKEWPVQGTTGYAFLGILNNLFTDPRKEKKFDKFYKKIAGGSVAIPEQILEKKRYILYNHMAGELENLCSWFLSSDLVDRELLKTVTQAYLKAAIGEFLVACPVYRYYTHDFPLQQTAATEIAAILNKVRTTEVHLSPALDLLEDAFLNRPLKESANYRHRARHFFRRCMQFSGPLMAKGVEDTLMYTNFRFIGHNEVGDAVEAFGIKVKEFHRLMEKRQQDWPLAINATSSHDTKRGEDVRARLNVLPDLHKEWFKVINQFQTLNQDLKSTGFPDANDEYFIYQTLIGVYPMPGQSVDRFADRLQEYVKKSLREAKVHSNWSEPNTVYEEATLSFTLALLNQNRPFWKLFEQFHQRVADLGIVNSLAQVLLKFTCPGVPDVYQGCELWDLSMVDPDNRRPVDFDFCRAGLDELETLGKLEPIILMEQLWKSRYDARIKLWLVQLLFKIRKQDPEIFTQGDYIPLAVKGKYKKHIIAFARRFKQIWYVVATPLHVAKIERHQEKELCALDWEDTRISLPPEMPIYWKHLFLHTEGQRQESIDLNTVFKGLPIALLKFEPPVNERGAGVLLHITSLPSSFGVGDFGPKAYAFADFLSKSGLKYWQILPLGPTEAISGHSPYNSFSGMAGNPLLISPEFLVREGWIDQQDLEKYQMKEKGAADFERASKTKDALFEQAWLQFKKGAPQRKSNFAAYCKKEADWLHDFALYVLLKQIHQQMPWYHWPENYKFRSEDALKELVKQYQPQLEKIKWVQYVFSLQWQQLKSYCNKKGIQLYGDLPIYVGHDSVDVWSHPELFCLDRQGDITGIAGVPPDYFNADGQLWGMPVFRWDVLKEQGYNWWVKRIRKNMELYDLIRLDHFRAFAAYWEVPAGEKTAKNGKWKTGPGLDFFKCLQKALGNLPFVAEDLGDIDDAVYRLRDEFNFPGMKVIQFAFGDQLSQSLYAPHNFTANYFVYPGTHDNNTTRGWFRQDASKSIRKQLDSYFGQKVTDKNVHRLFVRMALASTAKTAIITMQDFLGLDENARMNTPATVTNNWTWQMKSNQLTADQERQWRNLIRIYNRD